MKLVLKIKDKTMETKMNNSNNKVSINNDEFFSDICDYRERINIQNDKVVKTRKEIHSTINSNGPCTDDEQIYAMEIEIEIDMMDDLMQRKNDYINFLECFIYKTYCKSKSDKNFINSI